MDMSYYNPVKLFTGKGCLKNGAAVLAGLGSRCLIVTGAHGAKASGALDDLTATLAGAGIGYAVFDGIEQNPSYVSCLAAATEAKRLGAEFIVGVGGGSPLDAAKAVAVLTACRDTSPEAMYGGAWDATPLPVVAVGTTAGTGSEVTPVAVITSPEGLKKSLRAPSLYPVAAFGDATYTLSLSPAFTRSTALDALAHALESYFNRTANDVSRLFAVRAMAILLTALKRTAVCDHEPLTFDEREALYCASLYAGYAISVTGTAFPHALGYFLSEQHGVPHGNACAVYLPAFLRHSMTAAPAEARALFAVLGTDAEALTTLMEANLPDLGVTLTAEEVAALGPRYEGHKSLKKCLGTVDRAFAEALLVHLFVK